MRWLGKSADLPFLTPVSIGTWISIAESDLFQWNLLPNSPARVFGVFAHKPWLDVSSIFCDLDFIVLGSFIKALQDFASAWRDNARFIVVTGKHTNGVNWVKSHDRDEFNFITDTSTQKLNIFEAFKFQITCRSCNLTVIELCIDIIWISKELGTVKYSRFFPISTYWNFEFLFGVSSKDRSADF